MAGRDTNNKKHPLETMDLKEILSSINMSGLGNGSGEHPAVIRLVDHIIALAIQKKASDIHIEPEEKFLNVRYRIDAMLYQQFTLPSELTPALSNCLKTMGGLDVRQQRLPQDSHIVVTIKGKPVDLGISTCPTIHGENIVLRIPDKDQHVLKLASLGMTARDMDMFREMLKAPFGIFLVTGPAGSGKTSTLYSALRSINKENLNIMTAEDPVEHHFEGIRQVNINNSAGLTFPGVVRSFMRQDPDVIMAGEIRDNETAGLLIQAALTGHLVLSTLHTNDSASTFTRLIDMGVEPFLVSSSILGVCSQRLVRRVCEKCKEQYEPLPELLRDLGLDKYIGTGIKFARGRGCESCGRSGYKDRIGIYEILRMSALIQELVLKRSPAEGIRAAAVSQGLITLRQAGLGLLLSGLTTPEEVFRVALE